MVADVPVGAFLSGGLDSSAVVAFARNMFDKRRMQCFTIGFADDSMQKEGFVDDLPYAKEVARHCDVDLSIVTVGPEMACELEKMIYHLDEPQADPASLNVMFICQLSRAQGIKVLLSGAGGDDIFSGYRRHYALAREKYWAWAPYGIRKLLSNISLFLPPANPLARRLKKAFQYAHYSADQRIVSYFYWADPSCLKRLFPPLTRRDVDPIAFGKPLSDTLDSFPEALSPLDKMLVLEGRHFLPDHNLNYTDKMSMACGVEVRVPFLDVDLVKFAASLPDRHRQHGKTSKWIFKKAMEPYLPKNIIYRSKTGFGAPVRRWMKCELKEMVNDLLNERTIDSRGIFDATQVKTLRERDAAGRIDGSYTLLGLCCIELWCRIHLDRKANG